MFRKLLPFILLLGTVCNCPLFPSNSEISVTKEEFRQQVESVQCDNNGRFEDVKELFVKLGANPNEIVTERFKQVENIVVTVKGKTNETIIVGAHYDKTTLGCGAIDNWTGLVLIANLYHFVKTKSNQKTYKFVAFGKEEKGLIGSKAMAKSISPGQLNNYCAMINFDSFGFSDLWALESISDRKLIDFAKTIAQGRNTQFLTKNFRGASSDSKPFQRKGIPAITISGLGDDWRKYLHQKGDQLSNVNSDKVYDNLLFSAEFLNNIDSKPCDYFRR